MAAAFVGALLAAGITKAAAAFEIRDFPLFVLFGALLGVAVLMLLHVARVSLTIGLLRLGQVFVPLIVPFGIVAIWGSRVLSEWIQLALGAAFFGLCFLLYRLERSTATALVNRVVWVLRPSRRRAAQKAAEAAANHEQSFGSERPIEPANRREPEGPASESSMHEWTVTFAVVGAVVSLLLLALFLSALPQIQQKWVQFGGFSSMLVAGAVVFFVIALFARLLSFSTTRLRLVLVLPAFVAAVYFAIQVGIFPGDALADWLLVFLPGGHWFWVGVLVGVLMLMLAALVVDTNHSHTGIVFSRGARQLGLGATVVAALLLFSGLTIGGLRPARTVKKDAFGALVPGGSKTPPGKLSSSGLIGAYFPVLEIEGQERWPLSPVAAYLEDADVRLVNGKKYQPSSRPWTAATLPTECPGGGSGDCYFVTCAEGEGSCNEAVEDHPALYTDGVMYARVVRRQRLRVTNKRDHVTTQVAPGLFDRPSPFYPTLKHLLQFWFFYRYDRWEALSTAGALSQEHEGDWEAITIGFSDATPLFVAYSAHCGGEWRYWREISVTAAARGRKGYVGRRSRRDSLTHPLVAVARGSHANYPYSWDGRAPNFSDCRDIASELVAALSYAANLRDWTGSQTRILPGWIHQVDERTPPMSFPGRWGQSDRIFLRWFFGDEHEIGEATQGPLSPPLQKLWADPLAEIFCSPDWRPPWDGREKRCAIATAKPRT